MRGPRRAIRAARAEGRTESSVEVHCDSRVDVAVLHHVGHRRGSSPCAVKENSSRTDFYLIPLMVSCSAAAAAWRKGKAWTLVRDYKYPRCTGTHFSYNFKIHFHPFILYLHFLPRFLQSPLSRAPSQGCHGAWTSAPKPCASSSRCVHVRVRRTLRSTDRRARWMPLTIPVRVNEICLVMYRSAGFEARSPRTKRRR